MKKFNDKKHDGLFLAKQVVEQIGNVINRLSNEEESTKESVEKYLALVGMLVDSADEQKNTAFAESFVFIESIVNFTSHFIAHHKQNNDSYMFHTFYSHYSFELAIYTILCLLEHGSSAKTFLRSATMSITLTLVANLGEIMRWDHLYLTQVQSAKHKYSTFLVYNHIIHSQELSLEIVLRICHHYKQADREVFDALLRLLPLEVSSAVHDPVIGIPKLLRNMRDVLSAVNSHNPHVQSVAVSSLHIKSSETVNAVDRELLCAGYLDICREYVCFAVGATEKLIRLRISDMQRVHFATVVVSLQVGSFVIVMCNSG
jgi:hypothetical protein